MVVTAPVTSRALFGCSAKASSELRPLAQEKQSASLSFFWTAYSNVTSNGSLARMRYGFNLDRFDFE